LVDQQWVSVVGPDGLQSGFFYDKESLSLYIKESQIIIPPNHGQTHVTSDPVPEATCDLHGLMSADDKCKLDAITQMRVGVLGFQGSGYADDGGWISGDLILAAGSEAISLERVGNVVRFTVHNPLPLACDCEECFQIFWQQDESDVAAIRPPSCNGKMPGVNAYGELKIYAMPETAIADPSNPLDFLNQKDRYPSLIFKRYDDAISPGSAEFDMVLKRRQNKMTEIGWAFTPGATGKVECIWFMGDDSEGNERRFQFNPKDEPGLLGELLYKGHLLSKQMGVIVDYESSVVATNQYVVKYWDVNKGETVGDSFTATNVWQYNNPESAATSLQAPKSLVVDATRDLLPIGTLVSLWEFQITETNGVPTRRRFFSHAPNVNPAHLWTTSGVVRFGDLLISDEGSGSGGSDVTANDIGVADIRLFERTLWGITDFDDSLILSDDGEDSAGPTHQPSGEILNGQLTADIDYNLPGLVVRSTDGTGGTEPLNTRPVMVWNRHNHRNVYSRFWIGMPPASKYPPYDILLRAPIDSFDDVYMKVLRRGQFTAGPFAGNHYIVVKGARWRDLPSQGIVETLTPGHRNLLWRYYHKAAFAYGDDNGITLVGDVIEFPFMAADSSGTMPTSPETVRLLREDYNAPCVRCEFSVDETPNAPSVQLQIKVGILDVNEPYELDRGTDPNDDLVYGMAPGYTVSRVMTQDGFIIAGNEDPNSDPTGFRVYKGGNLIVPINGVNEAWNLLEIMYRDSQCFIWWNGLLVPPDQDASLQLPDPVVVNTPYFPLISNVEIGKVGMRMWPGATVRKIEIRDQASQISEYQYGQLQMRG